MESLDHFCYKSRVPVYIKKIEQKVFFIKVFSATFENLVFLRYNFSFDYVKLKVVKSFIWEQNSMKICEKQNKTADEKLYP